MAKRRIILGKTVLTENSTISDVMKSLNPIQRKVVDYIIWDEKRKCRERRHDMDKIAKVIGRLIATLINKGIITNDDALYVLDPLEEGEKDETSN